jgi:hypothetical protein
MRGRRLDTLHLIALRVDSRHLLLIIGVVILGQDRSLILVMTGVLGEMKIKINKMMILIINCLHLRVRKIPTLSL